MLKTEGKSKPKEESKSDKLNLKIKLYKKELNKLDESENDNSLDEIEQAEEADQSWKHRKWFWQINQSLRIKWEILVMLLAIWNWFWVPFDAAFSPNFANSIEMELFNSFIDLLYMFDIFINFRTSYIEARTGEEIFDLKRIAVSYAKGRFCIDIISSIPFNILTLMILEENLNSVVFKMFSLLKLMRILRLSRILMYMNLKDNAKMSLKLAKLLFFIIMYLHLQGWAWYIIVKTNETWIPPLDYVYIVTGIYEETVLMKYFTALYYSTVLLAGGDIGPRGEVQLWFWIVTLIVWAIINANIFGNLAVLISSMNRKSTLFQDKMDTVNTAMRNMKLPEVTQK